MEEDHCVWRLLRGGMAAIRDGLGCRGAMASTFLPSPPSLLSPLCLALSHILSVHTFLSPSQAALNSLLLSWKAASQMACVSWAQSVRCSVCVCVCVCVCDLWVRCEHASTWRSNIGAGLICVPLDACAAFIFSDTNRRACCKSWTVYFIKSEIA